MKCECCGQLKPDDLIENSIQNEMCEGCNMDWKIDDHYCDACEFEMRGYE